MADQDDTQKVDPEEIKTPSSEQREDEATLVDLEKEITTSEKLLSNLKKYDQALREVSQQKRDNMIQVLDDKMKSLAKEWADLSSAAQKVVDLESLSPNERKALLKIAVKYKSFWDQSDALEKSINNWFGVGDLLIARAPYTIYEAYQKIFDDQESPQFAKDVSRTYYNEAVARDILIDRLNAKKLSLELTSTKEFFLPSQPNTQQLQDLENRLAQQGAQKKKLLDRIAQRQKFYEKYRERLLEHEQANAARQERELKAEDEERISQTAVQAADRFLAELEAHEDSYFEEVVAGGGQVPMSRPITNLAKSKTAARTPRGSGVAGSSGWLKFWRDPRGSIRDFWGRFGGKGKEGVPNTLTQQGEKALEKGATTRLGMMGGAIGLAISLGIRLFTDKELQEKLKNAAVFAGLNLYLWLVGLMTNLVAGTFGIVGGIAGIIIGAKIGAAVGAVVGGPVGAVIGGIIGGGVGGIVGWVAGYGVGNVVSGALVIGGTPAYSTAASTSAITGTTAGVAASGFWGLFTGTSTTAIASVSIGTAMVAVGTVAAITTPPPENENQGPEPTFEITKTANPISLPNFTSDDEPKTITYSLSVTSKSAIDIQIKSVSDTVQIHSRNGKKLEVQKSAIQWSKPDMKLSPNNSLTGSYTATISPNDYSLSELNDSTLVNTITLVGETMASEPESRTESATENVKIGNPQDSVPFGYPASGTVTSIDFYNGHCGTFLTVYGRKCSSSYDDGKTSGGLDVAGANQSVYATLDGTVELAEIDTGLAGQNCGQYGKYTLCKWALGGVVYIRSFSGQYLAAYLHLDNLQVKTGDKVTRGKQIGTVFDGELPTTKSLYGNNPGHVHYQILRDGLNFNFASNSGACTDSKLLPSEPVLQNSVSSGPFECGGGI